MSGGEPSSIKQCRRCATRLPVLSRDVGKRVERFVQALGVWSYLDAERRRHYTEPCIPARFFQNLQKLRGVRPVHLALYRKYRPTTFDDVCGQEHITTVLKYQAAVGKVSHAYLFCGSRGTGKTTSAKILAKAVNCLSPVDGNPCGKCDACLAVDSGAATDVVEMDAASNNGVDNIRDLRDEVTYKPAMLKRRVYIIDEVHMLSVSAFNALLKTLEEPPEHVLFILATTELHKLPTTIISRCQRFDFRRIGIGDITKRLHYIAQCENITLEDSAAERIARLAEGGMRDAVSLLEHCAGGGAAVTDDHVREVLGVSGYGVTCSAAEAVQRKDMKSLFATVAKVAQTKDISVFWQELISFWRDMLVAKYADDFKTYLDITESEAEMLSAVANKFPLGTLVYQAGILDDAMRVMTRSPHTKRVTAELALVRMCQPEAESTNEALLARISELEDKVKLMSAGAYVPAAAEKVQPVAEIPSVTAEIEDKIEAISASAEKVVESPVVSGGFSPVPDISGVVERLQQSSPAIVDFFRTSRVEISDDGTRVRVIPDSDFARRMLGGEDAQRSVSQAFLLAGICSGVPQLTVEKAEKGGRAKASNPIDDLF